MMASTPSSSCPCAPIVSPRINMVAINFFICMVINSSSVIITERTGVYCQRIIKVVKFFALLKELLALAIKNK